MLILHWEFQFLNKHCSKSLFLNKKWLKDDFDGMWGLYSFNVSNAVVYIYDILFYLKGVF